MDDKTDDKARLAPKYTEKDIKAAIKSRDFKLFLWNSETGEFLGRNGESWLKITVFYIFFFLGLGLFFWGSLYIALSSIEDDSPKYILAESLIGTNPGLSMRPQTEFIQFTNCTYCKERETMNGYIREIDDFIKEQKRKPHKENRRNCRYGALRTTEKMACIVNINDTECSKKNGYGFGHSSTGPCFLLKINKIYGWEPKFYGYKDDKFNETVLEDDLKDLRKLDEEERPSELIRHIENFQSDNITQEMLKTVWIDCKEKNSKEENNKNEKFIYKPQPGIPGFNFPYKKQNGYQTSFIFVKIIVNPNIEGTLKIICKAWAKNIHPDKFTRAGIVTFEIKTVPIND